MSYRVLKKGDHKSRKAAPVAVKGILSAALKKYGIEPEIERYRFMQSWREIVGDEIARRAKPEFFRNGKLFVRVVNSVWAQELSFQKEVIISKIRSFRGGEDPVRDIVFQVGRV